MRTASALLTPPPEALLSRLTYSHFELLVGLEDDLRRGFYEAEAIRGQWSVRELRRQIGKVQDFLLELGRGFCFEARQKRIRIGGDFFFV